MRTATTPQGFGAIPCSRWRSTVRRRIGSCVRSPPSRAWRTCPMPEPCSAWGGCWSSFIARSSGKCRSASCSTSMTRLMPFTAARSCACSMLTTTNTGSSRSSCSTVRGRFVTAVLRPAQRPKGTDIRALLRRLLRAIRANWPATEILLRADSHYCGPEVIDWCRANGVDFIFGVAPTSTLRRHIVRLEASTMARSAAAPHAGKVRRYTEFYDGATSWSRVERIIARIEAGAEGTDTRFIVTSLPTRNARVLYEDVYCRRGAAENHIKSWKTHLAADRTSCTKASANQFRLFLHAGAYWLLWSLRSLMPKRSPWRVAQFDTLR